MEKLAKDTVKKTIGYRIANALRAKDIRQKELSEITGIIPSTISSILNGSRMPNTEQLICICKALEVSSDYILGFTESMQQSGEARAVCDYTGLNDDAIALLHDDGMALAVRMVLNALSKTSCALSLASSLLHYIYSDTSRLFNMDSHGLLVYSGARQRMDNEHDKSEDGLEELEKDESEIHSLTFQTYGNEGSSMKPFEINSSFWDALFMNLILDDLRKIKEELKPVE